MKINRSQPPLTDPNIKFSLPEIEQFKLKNGLRITFVEKSSLPIIQMGLITNAGSRFDPIKRHGLAYLTSLLIDEGAGEYSALELDNEFESLGSIFSVSTDSDLIYLNLLSLKEKFERSLELLAKVYSSPLFTDQDFEREQQKLQTKIIRSYDDPSFIASANHKKLIFKDSPFAHPIIGDSESIKSIKNDEVKNFFNQYFVPANSDLIVVGSISRKELETKLNRYLNSVTKQNIDRNGSSAFVNNKSKIFFIHKDDAAQSEIRVGHLTNKRTDPDYYAKTILNSILGGQFSSRLNLNLREDKGFTYGVSSGFYYNEPSGYFQIATSVQSENTGQALEEINKEIVGIKDNVSDKEIDFVKSYLIKRFPAMFETYSQIANNLTSLIHHSLDLDYFNNYIKNIESCSKVEIENAAKQRIVTDDLIYLIVGNEEVVLPQLENLSGSIIKLDKYGNKAN